MAKPSDKPGAPTLPTRRVIFALQTPAEREQTRAALGKSSQQRPQDGFRELRISPLTKEDLYLHACLPAFQPSPHDYQICSLCKNTKAHPVSYPCGHSHCYACIRIHLETRWECPRCQAVIRAPPHRHEAEEESIANAFPRWAASTSVAHVWDGLVFPVACEDPA
ncbi:hypothetical protein C8R47DRAFT_1214048 [Mycena vitilis]|nr:hypothetical protein C8R47DRAFT_1214048 [Mycena vitilis]